MMQKREEGPGDELNNRLNCSGKLWNIRGKEGMQTISLALPPPYCEWEDWELHTDHRYRWFALLGWDSRDMIQQHMKRLRPLSDGDLTPHPSEGAAQTQPRFHILDSMYQAICWPSSPDAAMHMCTFARLENNNMWVACRLQPNNNDPVMGQSRHYNPLMQH